jgi:phage shock protein A
MSLADRARAALWGNLNALVTRLEQSNGEVPGLLEQMGQEIQKAKRELVRVMGEEKVLRERSKSRVLDAHQWQSRAELAVRASDDTLARDALVQYRRLQGESARDAAAADEYGSLAQSIRTDIAEMEKKHRAWTARQSTLGTLSQQAHRGGGVEALGAQPGRQPFEDLRRIEESIDNAEAGADARNEVDALLSPGADLEQRFAQLQPPDETDDAAARSESTPDGEAADPKVKRRVRVGD